MKLEEPRRRRRSGEDSAVLPPELLDLIVLRLPLASIARARCVCKSWNDAIRSKGFAESKARLDHEQGQVPKGWLLTLIGRFKRKWVWLYDPHSGQRHQMMLPPSLKGTFVGATVVGAFVFIDAGCIYSDGLCYTKFWAWNPITAFVTEVFLPQTHNFAVVSSTLSTKLYSLPPSPDNVEHHKKIFSSPSPEGSWNRIDFLVHKDQSSMGTFFNGFVYATKSFRDRTVLAQDTATGKMLRIDLPPELERRSRWGVKLVQCEKSLLLMAACTPQRREGNRMQVWKLVGPSPGSRWEFVSAMPDVFYELVFRGKVTQYNWRCTAVDKLIYFFSVHRRVEQQEGVVIFDIRKLSWRNVDQVSHQRHHCPWSDPRPFYPSFASLDVSTLPKSIAEISSVLGESGGASQRPPHLR